MGNVRLLHQLPDHASDKLSAEHPSVAAIHRIEASGLSWIAEHDGHGMRNFRWLVDKKCPFCSIFIPRDFRLSSVPSEGAAQRRS